MRQLQDAVRLEDSLLWELMARSYQEQGPEAWARGLPMQVTANPWLARAFARVVHGLLVDVGPGHTVEVLEVGPGPGRFAFHLLQALDQLTAASPLPCAAYRLTLLELAPRNVAFIADHERMQGWLDQGRLRVQVWNAETDPLPSDLGEGPVICLATYVLDSLRHTLSRVQARRPFDRLVRLYTDEEGDNPGRILDSAKLEMDTVRFTTTGEPVWDDLMAGAYSELDDVSILFPIGGLTLFRKLVDRPGGGLLLFADKGWSRPEHFLGTAVAPHAGTLSAMVNVHALQHIVQAEGGWWRDEGRLEPTLQVGLLAKGPAPEALPHMLWAWQAGLGEFGPLDAHRIQGLLPHKVTAEIVMRLLRLSAGDPWTFERFQEPLFRTLERELPEWLRESLVATLEQVWAARYRIPGDPELAFPLGACMQRLMEPLRALELYAVAEQEVGVDARLRFNQACCFLMLHEERRGRALLHDALRRDPQMVEVHEVLAELEAP